MIPFAVPHLEQADDIMVDSCAGDGFQLKLNESSRYSGRIGCELQLTKCVYSVFGENFVEREWRGRRVTLNGVELEKKSTFKYVGTWFQSGRGHMFREHYKVNAAKAGNIARSVMGVEKIVGHLSAWEMRTLYMARVDPYLINGLNLESLEKVQIQFLRRMMDMGSRSMLAVLFTETGIEPIRYRRILLAFERLAHHALWQSVTLARKGHDSWALDLQKVMLELPIPVRWDLMRNENRLQSDVTRSMEVYLQHEIDHSSRVRDLLFGRREWDKDARGLVVKVLAFRHYLRVKNSEHRRAVTHVMLSGHALAMERMRWTERRRRPIPREWRLCRLCLVGQEDVVHALVLFLDPGLFLRALMAERETIDLVAKFCYDVLKIFYARPMLLIRAR
ncbi:hypothetical protein C8J56DRAFT_1004387 [Mycena floridula]|nr:hypothetical protein C8J56DRAFT_1004387 [Mycena floridula]